MKVIDPGHAFTLDTLDGDGMLMGLRFVKRIGTKYPGNTGSSHCGTTLQETWRAGISRLKYLDGQQPDSRNLLAIRCLEEAIFLLECRAADHHGRTPLDLQAACYGATCAHCLHVGCEGNCQSKAPASEKCPKCGGRRWVKPARSFSSERLDCPACMGGKK